MHTPNDNKEDLLKHLAASLQDAKKDGGAILLVGAGISVSAGIPPAQKLMKIAIENFPNYFTDEEQRLAQEDLSQLQYNDIMTKLSNVKRKELFKWFIKGDENKGIKKAKLNFAHIAIAELLKQGYFSRILTVNFDPLLIHACYMVGMYPLPAIYDLGSVNRINPELFNDPCIIYLNGQHVGQVQRNTTNQLAQHDPILQKVVHSTGCTKTWVVAGYSGENDPLMDALTELRPFNNWLYWLEYNNQILQKETHTFLESDEECKLIYGCDADEIFMKIADLLNCDLDFIEKPETELNEYKERIDFNTAGKKENLYNRILDAHLKSLKESGIAISNFKSLTMKHLDLVFGLTSGNRKDKLEDLIESYLHSMNFFDLESTDLQNFCRVLLSYANEFEKPEYINLAKDIIEKALHVEKAPNLKEKLFYRAKSIYELNRWISDDELRDFIKTKKK